MAYSDIHIAAEALSLRDQLGLSVNDPVGSIDDLASEIGYEIFERSFGDNYSAFCMNIRDDKFAIVLNSDHHWNERFRRFTISHEIAHLTLIEHRAALHIGRLGRSSPEFQSTHTLEREADFFAINILAPRRAFELATVGKNFSFESISEVSDYFNISILAAAFRFVELTDLTCSLVTVDASSGLIKYEKRSKAFQGLGNPEFLNGKKIPARTNLHDVFKSSLGSHHYTEFVDLIDWYPEFKRRAICTESIMPLAYNNTYVVLIELQEDFDDD